MSGRHIATLWLIRHIKHLEQKVAYSKMKAAPRSMQPSRQARHSKLAKRHLRAIMPELWRNSVRKVISSPLRPVQKRKSKRAQLSHRLQKWALAVPRTNSSKAQDRRHLDHCLSSTSTCSLFRKAAERPPHERRLHMGKHRIESRQVWSRIVSRCSTWVAAPASSKIIYHWLQRDLIV